MKFVRLALTMALLIALLPIDNVFANKTTPQAEPINLARGAKYTVKADVPNATFSELEYKTYSGPVEGLASSAPTWTGFARQDGREIEVDLGAVQTIQEVSLQFRHDVASAITLPPYMKAEVSEDGQRWHQLGRLYVAPPEKEYEERTYQFVFEPLRARYVKLYFPVEIWAFARHLKIMGYPSEQAGKPVLLPHSKEDQTETGAYMDLPNIRDILLIYTGAHEEKGTWTKDEFKSVVAYMKNGQPRGKMFDTLLFLPYEAVESTEESWTAYIEDLFRDDAQLGALNQAIHEIDPHGDFKEQVILSVPFPDSTKPDFWTDENKEGIETVNGQKQAIKWYVEKLLDKWKEADYDRLELVGIYWWKEKIETHHTDENELVKYVASLVHRNHLPFFWIPYYGAHGYSYWKELGFDHVIIQPNYYAREVPKDDRMNDVARLARQFEMGVEVEIDEWTLISRYHYDAFYDQLDQGHRLGFDQNVTNAYYTGSKTIPELANSEVPAIRKIYDDLYLWIQGEYRPTTE